MSRTFSASSLPMSLTTSSKEMFSSCPDSALVAGVKMGCGSFCACCRPLGSSMPQILAGLLVVLPARADDVAAHHRLDGQGLQLLHHHRAALDLRLFVFALHHALRIDAGELVGNDVAELAEPEVRHFVEHPPLLRDGVGQDHVEGREPVAHDDQHLVVADAVDVAHLAPAEAGEALQAGSSVKMGSAVHAKNRALTPIF